MLRKPGTGPNAQRRGQPVTQRVGVGSDCFVTGLLFGTLPAMRDGEPDDGPADDGAEDEFAPDEASYLDDVEGLELTGEAGGENAIEGSSDPFFVSKQAAAVFKHKLLSSYFPKFAGKAGSNETGQRLVYVDTHAGRGAYDDGTDGSPLLIARTSVGMREARRIDCLFIELGRSNYRRLSEMLEQEIGKTIVWKAVRGSARGQLDTFLEFAGNSPLFTFVDPYGLGLSFDEVVRVLNRPRTGYSRKTEVLLNFISGAFARAGAAADLDKGVRNRAATLEHLDAVLGGQHWREIYLSADSGAAAAAEIAHEYANSIAHATGCHYSVIPVKNRAHHEPVYWLVHFTFHPDGVYWMRDAAGRASAEWRKYLAPPVDDAPPMTLFDDVIDSFPEEEKKRTANWVDEIERNALTILARKGSISVSEDQRELFGEADGLAWSTHLLQALQRIWKEGVLDPRPYSRGIEKYTGTLIKQEQRMG